jgi:hypothetical protein
MNDTEHGQRSNDVRILMVNAHTPAIAKAISAAVAERIRQQRAEGFSCQGDDDYRDGELANAAACYAIARNHRTNAHLMNLWPWAVKWWKPGEATLAGRHREITKAMALLLAEAERIDRLIEKETPP